MTESYSMLLQPQTSDRRGGKTSPHPIRKYVERVASLDYEEYPEWDLTRVLPKLPIPDLEDTLNKYLQSIKPLVSSEQYDRTKAIVHSFGAQGSQGQLLQDKLKQYAETVDNWAYHYWLDDMYMRVHLPLPVNSNPGMVFPRQYFQDRHAQIGFAVRLIAGIIDYKLIIDSRSLPIDRARHHEKGQPLCMDQYYRLFTSYRIPGTERDTLSYHESCPLAQEPEHIIVVCKNQFFVMEVMIDCNRLSDENLFTQLRRILRMADEGEKEVEKVGILTGTDRTKWAEARLKLLEDPLNQESLDLLERCIFVICLDKATSLCFNHQNSVEETSQCVRDDVSLAMQMLHGHGSRQNSCNRWFDKTMQFVVGEDGACGLCYEHSPSEGIAVVQLIEHLLKYMEERQRRLPRMQSLCDLPHPRKLSWRIPDQVQRDISQAICDVDNLIENLDLFVLRFTDFGKNFPKTQNMSPDAFIQLAYQLTYYKVHHCLVSTYESASLRRFRQGRVDNIRACTLEALDWARAMVGETQTTDEEKILLLRRAVKKQTTILLQTILGYGFDNHLLGLREIALEEGMETPKIFQDDSYKIGNHFSLSTSQVPTTMDAFMCYGPVVPDGYGVCYNPHPDYIQVCVSSFKSWEGTDSTLFATTLESTLRQMQAICTHAQRPPICADTRLVTNGNSFVNGTNGVTR